MCFIYHYFCFKKYNVDFLFIGLVFLASNPELSTTIIHALRGTDKWKKEESVCLRYASALISKGFFCHPHEVAMIVEMHLKAVRHLSL